MNLKGRGTQGRQWLLNFLRDLGTRQMLQSQVIPERLHNSVKGIPYMLLKSDFHFWIETCFKMSNSEQAKDHHTQKFWPKIKFSEGKKTVEWFWRAGLWLITIKNLLIMKPLSPSQRKGHQSFINDMEQRRLACGSSTKEPSCLG